jgi:hypothetical protein
VSFQVGQMVEVALIDAEISVFIDYMLEFVFCLHIGIAEPVDRLPGACQAVSMPYCSLVILISKATALRV